MTAYLFSAPASNRQLELLATRTRWLTHLVTVVLLIAVVAVRDAALLVLLTSWVFATSFFRTWLAYQAPPRPGTTPSKQPGMAWVGVSVAVLIVADALVILL